MATHKIAKFPAYTVNVSIEPEHDTSPDENFASGDDDVDRAMVEEIDKQLNRGNQWAWCQVEIVVTHDEFGLTETRYLGACSYASEDEFVQGGDYFDDMAQECVDKIEELIAKIRAA